MKASVSPTPVRPKLFPESQIRTRMKQFWNEMTDEEDENPFKEHTLHDVLPDIDSLEIVKFMLRIEEIIDIEIPPKFIKRGGYDSCAEMIGHLMPQLQDLFTKSGK